MVIVIQYHSITLISHINLAFAVFAEQTFFQTFSIDQDIVDTIAAFTASPQFSAIRDAIASLFLEQDQFQALLSQPPLHSLSAANLLYDRLLQIMLANRLGG